MRRVRPNGRERGASIVEFALIAPLFVLLTLGVVDIGRAFMVSNQVRGAAREAGAYVQNHPTALVSGADADECPDPQNARWKALNERGASDARVQFSSTDVALPSEGVCGATGLRPGHSVVVKVSRDLPILTPFVGQFIGDGSTMRVSGQVEVVIQGAA